MSSNFTCSTSFVASGWALDRAIKTRSRSQVATQFLIDPQPQILS